MYIIANNFSKANNFSYDIHGLILMLMILFTHVPYLRCMTTLSVPSIADRLTAAIRTVPDFPQPGILFKDITPIFLDWQLCSDIAGSLIARLPYPPDAVCVVESRGFLIGMLIAHRLKVPLIPVRKKGKLPAETRAFSYTLEYGSATLEIHRGVIQPGWKVLIHDDILATGGTAMAAAELVLAEGGYVAGFAFIAELGFLSGRDKISGYTDHIVSIFSY
jgi:adenine phosphoribosyltransferase